MFEALRRLWRRIFGGAHSERQLPFTDETEGVSAQDLMKAMRAERGGQADPQAWAAGMSNLKSRVFSSMDRARLWRRERRKHPGDLVELELVTQPSSHDLAALHSILDQLSR